MKKLSLICCTLALSLTTATTMCKKQNQKTKPKAHTHHCRDASDKEGAIILGHFAGIVSNFFKLLEKPRDADHVGRSLGDMVQGLTNIIATAIKKGKKLEDHVQTPEFKEEVAKLIVKRMRMIEPVDHMEGDSKKL